MAILGLTAHVVDRLRAGWSPQQIAGRLCHETTGRHVYGPDGRTEQLHLCLPRARRRRGTRHGRRPRGHRIPQERGIACRPAEVATRESFGHQEGDLLIFAREGGPANVTTLPERRSRFLVLLASPNRRTAAVAGRIGAALGSLDTSLRRTVTFHRGFELIGYPALDRGLAVTSCLCDPRSPWQEGAVENGKGRLRRHLPSDVPAERLMAESLQALPDRLDATPRRCLGYCTPAEVFEGRLDPTAGEGDTAAAVLHLA